MAEECLGPRTGLGGEGDYMHCHALWCVGMCVLCDCGNHTSTGIWYQATVLSTTSPSRRPRTAEMWFGIIVCSWCGRPLTRPTSRVVPVL